MSWDFKKLCLVGLFLLPLFVFADVISSTNFKIFDSVMDVGGGRSTSTSFTVLQSFGQYMLGTSTTGVFQMQSGFLAFPAVTLPLPSASAGDAQVSVSWTASTGYVGWTVSGYNVGYSSSSAGPYSYVSAGNSLTKTITGLNNGTTYYFVVRPEDAFGYSIGTSTEVSATPVSAPVTPPSTVTPSGGGLIISASDTKAIFSGKAYPYSQVILLKDAQWAGSFITDSQGDFEITLSGFAPGDYIFSIYAKDKAGRNSRLLGFPRSVKEGVVSEIRNIFLPPTLDIDKSQVKGGDILSLFGQSFSEADVLISIEPSGFMAKTKADKNGDYFYSLSTSLLDFGAYIAKSRSYIVSEGLTSNFGFPMQFQVGIENVVAKPVTCPAHGDFNSDCRVNLVDFSILMYWFVEPNPPASVDMVSDGQVDIFDFSIMAYYWTG